MKQSGNPNRTARLNLEGFNFGNLSGYSTEDRLPEPPANRLLWRAIKRALLTHHHEPDLEGARVLYAAIAAHWLRDSPVWPMIVAPPGSMKTDLLAPLNGLEGVHLIDKLTPNTFLSGQVEDPKKRRTTSASLLHRIGPSGIVVYSDFSTLTSMNRDHRAGVLADMRRIYDGHLRKEFGTGENLTDREWRGRLTFVVAATPDIDRSYSVFQILGERFLMVRWHRPGGIEAALKAMNQDTTLAKKELSEAVQRMFKFVQAHIVEPGLTSEAQHKIAALAEFAVRGRTHVPRSGYNKEIIYLPEPEAATRLAQQLAQLTKGSALLAGRSVAGVEDFRLAQRAALDCIPASRRIVLDALMDGRTVGDVNLPKATLHYAVEDLKSQGLIAGEGLSPLAMNLLNQASLLLSPFTKCPSP